MKAEVQSRINTTRTLLVELLTHVLLAAPEVDPVPSLGPCSTQSQGLQLGLALFLVKLLLRLAVGPAQRRGDDVELQRRK